MKKQYNIPQTELFAVSALTAICGGSKPFGSPTPGGGEDPI